MPAEKRATIAMWIYASSLMASRNNSRPPKAFRRALRSIRPKPAFTLIPIAARRLEEKTANGDFFFATVLREGVLLAGEN